MKNDYIYDILFKEIRKKIPQNSILVNTLIEILSIEKDAVYRRLRREVPFTFQEIAIISKEMNISLDDLIGIGIDSTKSRPLQIKYIDYLSPSEIDYLMLDEFVNVLKFTKSYNNSEMATGTNILPLALYSGFEYLCRFYLFKWNYHYGRNPAIKYFHDIKMFTRIKDAFDATFTESKNIASSSFILDNRAFQLLVDDIQYFSSIRLISEEDVSQIKKELFRFLNYIESLAISGQYDNSANKVNFYISEVAIDTNYSYISAGNMKLSLVLAFVLNNIASLDELNFEKMKLWFRSIIRVSNLISVSGEKQRTVYFEAQRKIIDQL